MSETLSYTGPITRWQGEKATYHLLTISGDCAEEIAMHERMRRLELGGRRGFGSVKVMATIGGTRWKTSAFPSKSGEWWLLVGKKVLRAENLAAGDEAGLTLELL
ncbi:MAG: DUF1905 domain-containing protein [Erythrobacter sp.]